MENEKKEEIIYEIFSLQTRDDKTTKSNEQNPPDRKPTAVNKEENQNG